MDSLILLFAAMLRISTPILFASLGETLVERSGVLNLGIEGTLLLSRSLRSRLAASGAAPSSTGTAGAGGLEQQVVESIIDTAKRTGDWSEYEKHRAGILAGIAQRAR